MAEDSVVIEEASATLAVVAMTGEHDAYHAPRLESQLDDVLGRGLSVVIDLSGSTFLDSVTLFVLIRARKHAAERGLGFALQLGDEAGKHVHRAFELTRLTSVFAIASTREEALIAASVPVGLD